MRRGPGSGVYRPEDINLRPSRRGPLIFMSGLVTSEVLGVRSDPTHPSFLNPSTVTPVYPRRHSRGTRSTCDCPVRGPLGPQVGRPPLFVWYHPGRGPPPSPNRSPEGWEKGQETPKDRVPVDRPECYRRGGRTSVDAPSRHTPDGPGKETVTEGRSPVGQYGGRWASGVDWGAESGPNTPTTRSRPPYSSAPHPATPEDHREGQRLPSFLCQVGRDPSRIGAEDNK